MKVILDEWIVREVIDTLYMARTTLLGITGLDSPQEVAKKSVNQTAITRRISKAIDIIKQSEQPYSSKSLEEEQKCHGCFNRDEVFMRGMKYAKEQMMEEAIEGKVFMSFAPGHNQMVMADVDLPTNTKVRIIVLKDNEDESK